MLKLGLSLGDLPLTRNSYQGSDSECLSNPFSLLLSLFFCTVQNLLEQVFFHMVD